MEKPQIILYAQKSLNYTLFDSKWIPYSAKFIVTGSHARGTGALQIYELESGDVKLVKDVSSLTNKR
jgi:WD repeat-containing protein 92